MVRLARAAAKVADAHLGRYAIIGAVGGLDKRAGDAWDIYRILLDLDRSGEARDELSALPAPLRRVVADTAWRILIDRPTRTVSWLKAGDERMAAITAEELHALDQPVVDALRSD